MGLYPRLDIPKEEIGSAPLCIPLADKIGAGNPFWILSRNILQQKSYQSNGFLEMRKTKPQLALFYSILLGNESDMIDLLQKIKPSWFHIVWAKLYAYYQQEILNKILSLEI